MREGEYNLSDTVYFNEQDSGKEDAPVLWSAYNDEDVTISNGNKIPLSSFTPSSDSRIPSSAQGKVLSYNLRENGIEGYDKLYLSGHSQHYYWQYYMAEAGSQQFGYAVPEVYFGDKSGRLAEYPNNGGYLGVSYVVDEGTTGWSSKLDSWTGATLALKSSEVSSDRFEKWKTAQNPWYDSYWAYDWSDMRGPIKEFKSNSSYNAIVTEHALPYGADKDIARWRIYNLIEELDAPGEWYYDADLGELFIYPAEGISENEMITLAFQKKNIFELSNAHDIQFKNLNLTGTRASGIKGSNCQRIDVAYCDIYNLSSDGVSLSSSTNCKIYRNTIENVGARGILINGGNKNTLTPSGNVVENNLIKNYARLQKAYFGGVDVNGVGVTVRNNEICYAPQLAIAYGGNNHEFLNNNIHHVLSEASDMGAIYRVGDFRARGTVIKNNVFHDLETNALGTLDISAVYFDNAAPGDTATENIFYNIDGSGVFMNCGSNLTVTNNIFANVTGVGAKFACVDKNHSSIGKLTTGGAEGYITNSAYAKYPNFVETFSEANVASGDWVNTMNCVIKNNIGYNTPNVTAYDLSNSIGSTTTDDWLDLPYNDYNEGYNFTEDPGFKNLQNNNYTLNDSNSVTAMYPDFINIDMTEIGIQ